MKNFMMLIVTTLLCSTASAQQVATCHIMYDAGSSGTRLYIYEQQDSIWVQHEGPKVGALADPVREILGKKWSDAQAVVDSVVQALENIKKVILDDKGKPKWRVFDWSTQCTIESATVFATAGMRIAEQENRSNSKELWEMLNQKLQEKLGMSVSVTTRTLTGFEEGLYTWLTIRDEKDSHHFGIVEMGGASSQVTFPCTACGGARTIMVQGEPVRLYSYSFLGLGQNEALERFGRIPRCAQGAGKVHEEWAMADCADRMPLKFPKGIRDPYNYGPNGRGTYNDLPIDKADIWEWVLTGAFWYMEETDIEKYCEHSDPKAFEAVTTCFRAVYQRAYLNALGVSSLSIKNKASWTLGAVLCEANKCLEKAGKLPCRWSEEGCL